MKRFIYAQNINGSGMSGIIAPHDMIVVCLCEELKAKVIIAALEKLTDEEIAVITSFDSNAQYAHQFEFIEGNVIKPYCRKCKQLLL